MSIIDLPSGAKLEVRALKGREGKLLSDKEAIKSGLFLDKILDACTLGVLDPGAYGPMERFDWSKALIGDRFYALLQIRMLSLGEEFQFKIQCSEPSCRERFEYAINLAKDLPVKRLSDDDRALFASGNIFAAVDGNGKVVKYRLPIGKDEVLSAKIKSFDGAFLQALLARIVEIEGEAIPRRYLEDCSFADLLRLLEVFDEHNCGVNIDIEIQCPHCGGIEDVKLPFGRGFLVPTMKTGKPT